MSKKSSLNICGGLNRIAFLVALGIAIYCLYIGIRASVSEYDAFADFATDPLLQDIPEKVLGKGYSLKLNLIKNLFKYALFYPVSTFAIIYLVMRLSIWGTNRVIQWVCTGFKPNSPPRNKNS